jgi:two-component system sensor histidine kinase KdpD
MKPIWLVGFSAAAGLACGVVISSARTGMRRRPPRDPIHDLTCSLIACEGLPQILVAIERSFTYALGFSSAIFLSEGGRLYVSHHSSGFKPDSKDFVNAGLAISSGDAVENVRSSPLVWSHFLPLGHREDTLGAFAFRSDAPRARTPNRVWELAQSYANHASLAILRASLEQKARHAEIFAEADRLQKALFNSIAHNVRTPLSTIIGVLSTLQEQELSPSGSIRRDLLDTAREEAHRLNRVLGNLLDLSRLEAGALHVRNDPCDVQDVIGAALEQLGSAIEQRGVEVQIAPDISFVPMDFVLIVQVLVNLLDNALKYSPAGPPITVAARVLGRKLEIAVSDSGDGIPKDHLAAVFEKFNRGSRCGETGGIGLGLSICKGLIEAHRGTIWAERRQPCGTAVRFTLPMDA